MLNKWLPWEKRLKNGHGKFRKVMESHGILKVSKSTNPAIMPYPYWAGGVSIWKCIKYSESTLRWRDLTTHNQHSVWICFREKFGKENLDLIVLEKLRFQNSFRPHYNSKPTFSNSSGFKSVFEKRRISDGLRLVFTSVGVGVVRALMTWWKLKIGVITGVISSTESESEELERFHFLRFRLRLRENYIVGVGSRSGRTNQSQGSESSIVVGLFFRFCFQLRQFSFHWIISDGVIAEWVFFIRLLRFDFHLIVCYRSTLLITTPTTILSLVKISL